MSRDAYRTKKRFGQHFLHDQSVIERIISAADIRPEQRVLEIGPGLGALTRPMLERGALVTALEVDRRVCAYLRDELGGVPGFVLHGEQDGL